jgi:hypothetical protein
MSLEEVGFSDDTSPSSPPRPEIEGPLRKNDSQFAFWFYINSTQFQFLLRIDRE